MPALPPVGSLIGGKYRVVRLIGEGGMGAVFEAVHEHLGSRVALKFLLPELAEQPGLVGRFLQEARVSASIKSPYVTQVMDVDQTPEGAAYLVMELLEGESLEQRMSRGSRMPMPDALAIAVQILSALEAAHAHGVVHRDLKPDNVWLSPSPAGPRVKLLDFGIAKLKVSGALREVNTRPGSMMGTPAYMAPEQAISADQVDARADLYSFGVILYEMLSGARPVDADDPATMLEKLMRGEIAPLASKNPSLPPGLCALVDRLVSPNPDQRPASASYVRGELSRYVRPTQQNERPSAVPPTVPPLDSGTPPFVTPGTELLATRTAVMPVPPTFGVAKTAVATSPPVLVAAPKKRGATGAVVVAVLGVALAAGGTWAYMNPSIFDDSTPPPLPGPAPTAAPSATVVAGQLDDSPPQIAPEEYRPHAVTERPPAQVEPHVAPQSHPAPTSTHVGVPTVLPSPTFSLPSSLPPLIQLPSGLPPIFQQIPGFSPPPAQQPAPQSPAPPPPPTTQPTPSQPGAPSPQPTSAPTAEPAPAHPKPGEPHRRLPVEPR
ncbi:MAG TPA: protein kinase [Polyangiaceae bacterium]|nr:protein kinase [Polyangiaceae bacterium]